MRTAVVKLSVSLVSVLVSTIVLEVGSMFFLAWVSNGPDGWSLMGPSVIQVDQTPYEDIPYILRPNIRYHLSGISASINSLGHRGPEVMLSDSHRLLRVLCIGDSITFGWAVHEQDTFCSRLADLLRSEDDITVEVINAGVPGYDQPTSAAMLLHYAAEYQPDLVVDAVTASNDVIQSPTAVDHSSLRIWLRDNSYTLRAIRIMQCCSSIVLSSRYETIHKGRDNGEITTPNVPFPTDILDPLWSLRIKQPILEMSRWAVDHNVRLVVVIFPTIDQVESLMAPATLQDVIVELGLSHNITVVDLLDPFRRRNDDLQGISLPARTRPLFADDFHHPNSEGHRIAADEIVRRLRNTAILVKAEP